MPSEDRDPRNNRAIALLPGAELDNICNVLARGVCCIAICRAVV
jgi:hypothetical protein